MTLTASPKARFTYREVSLQDRLREVAREVPTKAALIHGDRTVTYADLDAATDRFAAALAPGRLLARTGAPTDGAARFDDLVAEAAPGAPRVRVSLEDLAALPYTSGTTGFPKGVMLTHRNLTANQQQFFAAVPVRREDVFLNVLPYFHIYALNLLMAGAISLGATQVLMSRFDMVEYLTLVERHRGTLCFVVPPIVLGLAQHPEVDRHDLSSVRFFFSGAAPLAPEPARRMAQRMGKPIIQGYGLTETSPVTHANPVDAAVLESIGPAVPGTDDRIVDLETGSRDLGTGEVGEIAVRGPQG